MIVIYTLTIFHSALLLFLVQPMVGKMILPYLGGTPAVWNTCMVFFQAVLLAGYAYVHAATAWLGVRVQAGLHLLLMLVPLAVLPIWIDASNVPAEADNPVFWLLLQLLIGVGLPFFVISCSAPMLQKWFSATSHKSAHDPYFLYAASNLGSMIALLGYPTVMEPLQALRAQSATWRYGYMALVGMTALCAVALWRHATTKAATDVVGEAGGAVVGADAPTSEGRARPVTVWRRLRWVALAFVPSSLMLGVTTHVTTEIAPVPLLWVVPLAMYLLTFVLVFASRPPIPHEWVLRVFPFVVAPTALLAMTRDMGLGVLPLPLHLLSFFIVSMACHGEMAVDRPATRHLTSFYLLMSLGGVLGGLFNAVVAPMAFDTLLEYPLVIVLACALLYHKPAAGGWGRRLAIDAGVALAAVVAVVVILTLLRSGFSPTAKQKGMLALLVSVVVLWFVGRRPARLTLSLALVMIGVSVWFDIDDNEETMYESRNFYGTKRVFRDEGDHFRIFQHGSTVHGVQETYPDKRHIPRTYFHPTGPVGDIFRLFNSRIKRDSKRVAVIGLGVGSMASQIYARPHQEFVLYEIDPAVQRVAEDTTLFTFLADCPAEWRIVLGDGRLTLAREPDGYFQLMFLDAFSSDAVPTHLLTQEALQLYLQKLAPNGILVFNVTNRYLNLEVLLGNLAADAGLVSYRRFDAADKPGERQSAKYPSEYVVMARDARYLRALEYDDEWKATPTSDAVGVWTDQYTNIFRLLTY